MFGLRIRSNFEWRYLVNRTSDFGGSFNTTSLWFNGIRGDPDDKTRRGRLLGSHMGVDRLGIGSKGN